MRAIIASPLCRIPRRILSIGAFLWGLGLAAAPAAELPDATDDVFRAFTSHIEQQVQWDKQGFLEASNCTAWFYKQRGQKPPRQSTSGSAKCPTRYPGGLEAAREDLGRTQSFLSVSLTFYEFALVGDRNDDEYYSIAELRDILEAFDLSFDAVLAPALHVATLKAKFDAIHKNEGLDVLMAGMGVLYEKGYRFTVQDRQALNRVMG